MSLRIFRHYVSVPLLLLVLAELAVHVGAIFLAGIVRFLEVEFQLVSVEGEPVNTLPLALAYAGTMMTVSTALGLYSGQSHHNDREYRVRYLASFAAAGVVLPILYYAIPGLALGRGIVALGLAFSFLGTYAVRLLFFRAIDHDALKRRVLVLGSGSRALEVEALLLRLGRSATYRVVGFVPCGDAQLQPVRSQTFAEGTDLRELARKHRVDEIVVGVRDRRNGHVSMQQLLECKLDGVSVVDLPTFFEREIGFVELQTLSKSWLVFSEGFYKNVRRNLLKQSFDIAVSAVMLILTLPTMVLAAIAILLESGLPILYRQTRVGENGRTFEILKFRSMRVDAEKDGVARWASQNDARVTRVGRFLRRSRIDELPQLFNVLKGDMSFVGPRPERPPFVTDLTREIPVYPTRHAVKPGITGWAQICYPYGASVEDAAKKLQFDLYYVKNHSLFLDLVILLQTAQVVLYGKGAR